MTVKIYSYLVVNCNNEVVMMDSGMACNRMARKMNAGGYSNTPYRVVFADNVKFNI